MKDIPPQLKESWVLFQGIADKISLTTGEGLGEKRLGDRGECRQMGFVIVDGQYRKPCRRTFIGRYTLPDRWLWLKE